MFGKKLILGLGLITSLLTTNLYAQGVSIDEAYCSDMGNEEIYKEKRLSNYSIIIPGNNEWLFRTIVNFKKDFSIKKDTTEYLLDIQKGFEGRGSNLVLLLPPPRGLVHASNLKEADKKKFNFTDKDVTLGWESYLQAIKTLKDGGVNVVGVDERIDGENFFYKRDHHWSPDGAKLYAKEVAKFLKSMPSYADIAKMEFVTKSLGEDEFKGTFKNAFSKICDTELTPQMVEQYQTEPKVGAEDESALFDEVPTPDIVLLGTSNSSPDPNVANFDGFLKEYTGADVENLALAGAGIDTSLMAYINSDEFKNKPAKIVLWEVPGYYNINKMRGPVFMQAPPALAGDCVSDPIAEAKDIKLTERKFKLFDNLIDKGIKGTDYYVSLQFSKPIKKFFKMTTNYERYSDMQKFSRSRKYPTADGEFYASFRLDSRGSIKDIDFYPNKEMVDAILNARICKR